ncbi:hypothetical protein [Dactylosporangium salmoneum]|uniref:Uncharacterized protein n=1 Tax=Dactylosporangium salmoneum TaxID=53361 RepID=A0ABP5TSZ5_9ACTN
MLDDMHDLRAAVARFQTSAVVAGVPWHDMQERPGNLTAGELCRVLGVDRIPEQILWLNGEALPYGRVLPAGAFPARWDDAGQLLDALSASVGVPFFWRHQLPVLWYERVVFTFVVTGDREGEIWRYQFEPDDWNPVRAAPSLLAMFTEWNRGFDAGVYARQEWDDWLHVDAGALHGHALDSLAFPVHISQYDQGELLRRRQAECGVDLAVAEDFEHIEALTDEVDAVRKSLRL